MHNRTSWSVFIVIYLTQIIWFMLNMCHFSFLCVCVCVYRYWNKKTVYVPLPHYSDMNNPFWKNSIEITMFLQTYSTAVFKSQAMNEHMVSSSQFINVLNVGMSANLVVKNQCNPFYSKIPEQTSTRLLWLPASLLCVKPIGKENTLAWHRNLKRSVLQSEGQMRRFPFTKQSTWHNTERLDLVMYYWYFELFLFSYSL